MASPAPLLSATELVLESHRLAYEVRSPTQLKLADDRPEVAIVQGGPLQPTTIEVLRSLTARSVPTLVLVEGLNDHAEALLLGGGASDVVGLPASQQRLGSRIIALQRSASRFTEPEWTDEELVVDEALVIRPSRREVRVDGQLLHLTKTEFELLLALVTDPDRVLTRDELSSGHEGQRLGPRALESHLSRLRLKITQAAGPRLIESVRGVGYRLRPATSTAAPGTPSPRAVG